MFYIENARKHGQSDRIGCLLCHVQVFIQGKLRNKRMPNEGDKVGLYSTT